MFIFQKYFANSYRCCANPINFGQTTFFAASLESRISWIDWTVFPEFFRAREINQVFPKATLPGHSEPGPDDGKERGSFSSCFHFSGNQIARDFKTPDTHMACNSMKILLYSSFSAQFNEVAQGRLDFPKLMFFGKCPNGIFHCRFSQIFMNKIGQLSHFRETDQ